MVTLRPETLDEICEHAKSEFPNECCGVILDNEAEEVVWRCRNIQNELHQENPDTYPRDARTAYVIHPDDLIAVHKETDTQQRQIKAFYHSHPNHDAYFSEKDKADATVWGEPAYPGATYLVISVYDTEIRAVKAFAWDETTKDFIETKTRFGDTRKA
jgi:proteasome lid subunit RPN8/RPN11